MTSSSLVSALDNTVHNMSCMELGENNHPQYSWSNSIPEKIVQFSFQLTENGGQNVNLLSQLRGEYISLLKNIYFDNNFSQKDKNLYLNLCYKLIAQTRDIISGKGLYSISYMMVAVWADLSTHLYGSNSDSYPQLKKFGETLACKALDNFIDTSIGHPLGSWKDMKYFIHYLRSFHSEISSHPVFIHIIKIINEQLKKDVTAFQPSLLAKWIPREKSNKFGWITKYLAFDYYKQYLQTVKSGDHETLKRAQTKCLTHYRILISKLNEKLHTVQIHQCALDWKSINFDKNVTSITLRKQSFAFQDKNKRGRQRIHNNISISEDRKLCAENYARYILECNSGKKIIKSKNVAVYDLVKGADLLNNPYKDYIDPENIERLSLNNQWKAQSKSNKFLENMIAMVDTSGSMESDNSRPLYTAIGLGLKVAENSIYGKRILTFNAKPEWINLDNSVDFVDSVATIRRAGWGMNTNFYAALDLILETAIKNSVSPEVMKNTNLVIFSDMQIDQAVRQEFGQSPPSQDSLFDQIALKYQEAGRRSLYKRPYSLPHIIFWNLRTTSGFPQLSSTLNTSMLSGSNSNLFDLFQDKGANFLEDVTPWKLLQDSLNNKRYEKFELIISENINLFYN